VSSVSRLSSLVGFVSGFFVFIMKYKKKQTLVIFNNPLKVILKKEHSS